MYPPIMDDQLTFLDILDIKNKKRSKLASDAFRMHRFAQFTTTRAEMYLIEHGKSDIVPNQHLIFDIYELAHLSLCLFEATKWQKFKSYKMSNTTKADKQSLFTCLAVEYDDLENMVRNLSINQLEKRYKASLFEEYEHESLIEIFNEYDKTYEKVLKQLPRLKSYSIYEN